MVPNDGEVSVTLLLNGGHSRTLFLRRKDPLLSSLIASIGEKSYGGGRPARPFNIHLDEGRRSFMFSSTDLVGLIADPPLTSERAAYMPTGAPSRQPGMGEKSPYVLLENFVDADVHAELVRYVAAHEQDFRLTTGDEDERRSRVLYDFPEFADLFRDRVRALVPQLVTAFGLPEFPVGDIECELAAYNDGDYCQLHTDNGAPDNVERTISYVYYFHREPKGYSGGEFRLYNNHLIDGRYECGDLAADIDPKNNSVLLYPSHCHHEVLPVRCPSHRFVDGRFAINGWVRRVRAA